MLQHTRWKIRRAHMSKSARRDRIHLTASSLLKEIELLKNDAGLIRQFATTNSVKVDGKLYTARYAQHHAAHQLGYKLALSYNLLLCMPALPALPDFQIDRALLAM